MQTGTAVLVGAGVVGAVGLTVYLTRRPAGQSIAAGGGAPSTAKPSSPNVPTPPPTSNEWYQKVDWGAVSTVGAKGIGALIDHFGSDDE